MRQEAQKKKLSYRQKLDSHILRGATYRLRCEQSLSMKVQALAILPAQESERPAGGYAGFLPRNRMEIDDQSAIDVD
jgi:hypothetical protein